MQNKINKFLKNSILITIILVISLTLFSCKKESDYINSYPMEVREHVQKFMDEARARGLKIHHKKLKHIQLTGPIDGGLTDAYYDHSTNTIYFDSSNTKFKYKLEALVFHECAHAFLGRQHTDGTLPNGYISSIMNHALLPNYELPANAYQRQYYVDELFLIVVPIPDWAK